MASSILLRLRWNEVSGETVMDTGCHTFGSTMTMGNKARLEAQVPFDPRLMALPAQVWVSVARDGWPVAIGEVLMGVEQATMTPGGERIALVLKEPDYVAPGSLARTSPFAKPPKFSSPAEAEAWMEAHEKDAHGALDRVLRPRGR